MFDKLSELKDKSEYERIMKDYSNNYGFNLGHNSIISKTSKDKFDNTVNKDLNIKKR